MVEFEWDADKAASNLFNHGVSFVEGMTVLSDALEVMIPDLAHTDAELRFVSIGVSEAGRLLIVAYTERDQRIRIISARQATPREPRQYESKCES